MERVKKPEGLPNCKIIDALIEKANNKTDYEFDYIHQLDKVRNLISIEVSNINQLFPEYTPHDEKYHLKRLFFVADQMLDDTLIQSMNATELFLLAVCLYAHDWGMAINEDEKAHILSTNLENQSSNFCLLDNEQGRITEFCKTRGIDIRNLDISDWQEYVRLTHAFRSGRRIKHYFDQTSTGVAEFASRICEGHWLDFDIIDDHTSYPTDASIHRDIVNVKALTIYVRLIDLLDLGEDRTPFVLWKFVAPRNKFSKLEWAKHRALQPVTFPRYQLTRYIQVEGSTDDQNVYISIMDLKRYVDEQFRHCSDILNRINHSYHKLNISHLDWRIAARGFEPVAIQFEFDRNRMFEILGDEIYQSNPFIFLRELLQNAIDAITMRTEILNKRDLTFKPKIRIEVKNEENIFSIQITDNGIGMDEYIIRNYLAVAGKSYYRSLDFKKEGLKMDPISRFGIGVLSCFMIADCIEIETFKDPNTTQKQDHLKITIPSKQNFFQIKKNIQQFEIGTTFKIPVLKARLPKNKKTRATIEFNVTNYLKQIAGFVKYEITIIENGIHTIISNPNKINNEQNVFKIDYRFPIEKAFLPQHIRTANDYFVEKRFHLRDDLKLKDFDGCLTYILPKDDDIDIMNDGRSWPLREAKVFSYKDHNYENKKIEWNDEWAHFHRYTRDPNGDSSNLKSCFRVFMDGILLDDIVPPNIGIEKINMNPNRGSNYHSWSDSFVNPQLIVNIPKPTGMKIDLARTKIETFEKWDNQIWKAFFAHLKNSTLTEIESLPLSSRLLSLSKLLTFYKLSAEIVVEDLILSERFPIPFISKGGKLKFQEFDKPQFPTLRLAPSIFSSEMYRLVESQYVVSKLYSGILTSWSGCDAMINFENSRFIENSIASLTNMGRLVTVFIKTNYWLSSIEFISSPLGSDFPLVQEVFKLKDSSLSNRTSDNEGIHFNKLNEYEVYQIGLRISNLTYGIPKAIRFPPPFESKISFSFKYINLGHPIIQKFTTICLHLADQKIKQNTPDESHGRLFDLIKDIPFIKSYYSQEEDISISTLNQKFNALFTEAKKSGIIEHDWNPGLISLDDFVLNSIIKNRKKNSLKLRIEYSNNKSDDWAKPIS